MMDFVQGGCTLYNKLCRNVPPKRVPFQAEGLCERGPFSGKVMRKGYLFRERYAKEVPISKIYDVMIHTLYTICIPSIYNILYASTYTLC